MYSEHCSQLSVIHYEELLVSEITVGNCCMMILRIERMNLKTMLSISNFHRYTRTYQNASLYM